MCTNQNNKFDLEIWRRNDGRATQPVHYQPGGDGKAESFSLRE